MIAAGRVTQLAQCLGFNLTNPLTGNIELLADFLEGMVGVHVDAEAHAQHLGFTGSEAFLQLLVALSQGNDLSELQSELHEFEA